MLSYPHMSKPNEDKNLDLPDFVIKELLTTSEIRMLKNRWQIVLMLQDGLSTRQIASRVGVGTDTVVRIARKIEENPQIKDYIKKPEQRSKWVFGQVSMEEK